MFWLVCRVLIWAFWSYSGQLGWLNFCVRATPSVFCFGLLSSLSRSDMAFTAVALHWNALGLNQTECFFLQWEGPFLNWKSTWSWKKKHLWAEKRLTSFVFFSIVQSNVWRGRPSVVVTKVYSCLGSLETAMMEEKLVVAVARLHF